jgi:hypothetical protein
MTAPFQPPELRGLRKATRERGLTIYHWVIGLILATGYINGAIALAELAR